VAVVVDVCCSSVVFRAESCYPILFKWLFKNKNGYLALCKHLVRSYSYEVRDFVTELDRTGRTVWPSESSYNQAFNCGEIEKCESNDPHVIALMLSTRVRLICTDDNDLIRDVKNPRLLIPRGKVYAEKTRRQAQDLLRRYGALGNPG